MMEFALTQYDRWVAKVPREWWSILLSILLHGIVVILLLLAMLHFHETPNDPIVTFEVVFGDLHHPMTAQGIATPNSETVTTMESATAPSASKSGKKANLTEAQTHPSLAQAPAMLRAATWMQKTSQGHMRQGVTVSSSLPHPAAIQSDISPVEKNGKTETSMMEPPLPLTQPEPIVAKTAMSTATPPLGLEHAPTQAPKEQVASYEELLALWFEDHRPKQIFTESLNVEGHAMLQVTIASDGTIVAFQLEKSTGNSALDAAILETAKLANPVPPFPSYYAHERLLRFRLPIAF
jgi:TonB family protein